MLNNLKTLMGLFLVGMLSVSCENGTTTPPDTNTPPEPVVVTDVKISVSSAVISPLETLALTAGIEPRDADNKLLAWKSDNESVATVDDDGVVTPTGVLGSATITVTALGSAADSEKSDACSVTVNLIGTASFRSDRTWPVDNDAAGVHQLWSDVVMATGARKMDFDGGYYVSVNDMEWRADCCENPDYGDCFSWQAIVDYSDLLCPAPWRMPTRQDFVDLDIAFGGTGALHQDEAVRAKYMSDSKWGGQYGGFAASREGLIAIGTNGYYATCDEASELYTAILFLRGDSSNYVRPNGNEPKFNGWPVRCVQTE